SLPQRDTLSDASTSEWATPSELALARLRATLKHSEPVRYHPIQQPKTTVQDATRRYLILRQNELRPSGFKSVRYSVELFSSKYGKRKLAELTREDGREFLGLIAQLNPYIGKSQKTYGLSLDASVDWSQSSKARITGKTQHRIWSQVNHWLNWCVYEGELELEEVVGRPLRSSYNIPGREEFVPVNDHALQWYIYSQEQSPCEGYVQRVLRFQERTGRIVSPYERDV
ncbi:hypothetical protein KO510_08485, partial [Shimia thalassica]|nr:hypothetical protein [Shimia thalassica]